LTTFLTAILTATTMKLDEKFVHNFPFLMQKKPVKMGFFYVRRNQMKLHETKKG